MDAINKGGIIDKPYSVKDTLFFKIQGDTGCVTSTSKTIQAIIKKYGGNNFKFASTDEEAEDLWQSRKYALMSSLAAYPGSRCWTTDVWYVQNIFLKLSSSSTFCTTLFSLFLLISCLLSPIFSPSYQRFIYSHLHLAHPDMRYHDEPTAFLYPSCHNWSTKQRKIYLRLDSTARSSDM